MPNIITLPLGSYQTNCYVVFPEGGKRCVLIDPGYEAPVILAQLRARELEVDAILLTHGHFDHVGAVEQLCRETSCVLWMHRGDYDLPDDPTTKFFYPLSGKEFPDLFFCQEGQVITAADLTFEVLSTPGHTKGSVCYLCDDALFTGDTLFASSCGRTDLPGGDSRMIMGSLSRLAAIPRDLRVLPGHGGSSTLAREKQTNPYL